MKVEQIATDDVIPYDRNPRNNAKSVDKVAASISAFGWRQPIVVDQDLVVIAGHTRLMAAKKLGMDTVPIHIATGLTKTQVRAYRLADNRTGEDASWEQQLLGLEIRDLDDEQFNLDSLGFDNYELARLLLDETLAPTDENEQSQGKVCPQCGYPLTH